MPSSDLTELALRFAVNTNKRALTGEKGQAESIKDSALKRSLEMIQGSSSSSGVSAQMDVQSMAINIAVKGLEIAYTAISEQINTVRNQRLSFDRERQAGIGTFIMPINEEETNLSNEEKVIKSFIELAFKNSFLSTYLGIHSTDISDPSMAKFYSVLPFYRMSEALNQPVASTKPLDRQRNAIDLFFKSALPDALGDIESSFQTDSKFASFWSSAYQKRNYLNNRRAPRFLMMCLSNLLWNLQHPVDPSTGYPLSMTRCIELCRDVEIFLNQLLDTESPPCLQAISNHKNGLLSFMRKLEIHTKLLREAYAQEQLNELNIDDITNSAHEALRIMDKNVFKLIYKRFDFVSQKNVPDDKAAEVLADRVSYLNLLLIRNPQLIKAFELVPEWISKSAEINDPPTTIVDALIIFCHISWRERDRLLSSIEKTNTDSALEFAETLRKFDRKFLKPIKQMSKQALGSTVFSPRHQDVGSLTASRLIPFIALVVKDYQIQVDTPLSYEQATLSQQNKKARKIRTGKQQVNAINQLAETDTGYYRWSLSSFIMMSAKVSSEIDELPKRQFRLTQMAELLDGVHYLIKNHQNFLINKLFQGFLLKCLKKVKEEYMALDQYIDKIDLHLAQDERMSRNLQAIIRPMTRDLNASLDAFSLATSHFERLVSAPDFTEQQRNSLVEKINTISEHFVTLFDEDSGISTLMSQEHIVPSTEKSPALVTESPPLLVEARQVIALRKLVQQCYNALSYQSREGHKGALLRQLSEAIEKKPNYTEEQIKHIIMELTRITSSYRTCWLFQAAYGQTRSAQALIAAIKDPELNKVLPLASIVLEESCIDITKISNAQILNRLNSLKEGNLWQESAGSISSISISF